MNLYHVADALFPFFVLFYALDSITPVKTFQVVLSSVWGYGYRVRDRGLVLASLLPTARVYVASCAPVYFTSDGVVVQRPEYTARYPVFDPQRFTTVSYEEIQRPAVEGGTLALTDALRIKLGSEAIARAFKDRVERIRSSARAQRTALLHEVWRDSFSTTALESGLDAHASTRSLVRAMSVTFFALLFVILPLTLYTSARDFFSVDRILLGCGVLYVATVVVTLTQRSKLQGPYGSLGSIIAAAFSPVAVAHVAIQLEKERLASFDSALLAARFLTGERLLRFFRRELGVNRALMRMYPDHELMTYWSVRNDALTELADGRGLTVETIFGSRKSGDPTAQAFCAVCDTEYRADTTTCTECGVELVPY